MIYVSIHRHLNFKWWPIVNIPVVFIRAKIFSGHKLKVKWESVWQNIFLKVNIFTSKYYKLLSKFVSFELDLRKEIFADDKLGPYLSPKPVSHLISITTPEAHFIAIMVQMKTVAQKNETIPLGVCNLKKKISSSRIWGMK